MALEIDGTKEQQFAIMKSAVIQHDADLNGNGQPGIKAFVSSTQGQFRLIVILISVFGLILAIFTFLEANRQMHSKFSLKVDPTTTATTSLPPTYQPR